MLKWGRVLLLAGAILAVALIALHFAPQSSGPLGGTYALKGVQCMCGHQIYWEITDTSVTEYSAAHNRRNPGGHLSSNELPAVLTFVQNKYPVTISYHHGRLIVGDPINPPVLELAKDRLGLSVLWQQMFSEQGE